MEASVAFGKAPRRITFTFCNLQNTVRLQSNTAKHFDWNNIFTAIFTNGSIGKGIGDTRKGIKKNDTYDM